MESTSSRPDRKVSTGPPARRVSPRQSVEDVSGVGIGVTDVTVGVAADPGAGQQSLWGLGLPWNRRRLSPV